MFADEQGRGACRIDAHVPAGESLQQPCASKEQEAMPTVRARFANGVLKPMESLDLEEGQEVMVSVDARPPRRRTGRGMRVAAGAWTGMHDPEKLKRDIYATQLRRRCPRAGRNTAPLTSCGLVS